MIQPRFSLSPVTRLSLAVVTSGLLVLGLATQSFAEHPQVPAPVTMHQAANTGSNTGPLPADPTQWVCAGSLMEQTQAQIAQWCQMHPERGQPAPIALQTPAPLSQLEAKNAYDTAFQTFLRNREYATTLQWQADLTWRLTGPYVGPIGTGMSFGVHPAVRIYYSPEMIDWLCNDRQGTPPDGAMLIKEMHPINPLLNIGLDDDGCMEIRADVEPTSWAVMVKADNASFDGWYWANYSAAPQEPVSASQIGNPPIFDLSAVTSNDFFGASPTPTAPNPLWFPTGYVYEDFAKLPDIVFPYSSYGNYCLNCHASAQRESTFASLDNILGPGIRYKQFAAPAQQAPDMDPDNVLHTPALLASTAEQGFTSPLPAPSPGFLNLYNQLPEVTFTEVWPHRFPAETYDHAVVAAAGPQLFFTSDQCLGCHDATFSNDGRPNMLLEEVNQETGTKQLINLSPYGEWRASPMGLAGRDPIFFAQLQSEANRFPQLTPCMENTCLHCHGVMGQRQLALDTPGQDVNGCNKNFGIAPPPEVPFGRPFRREMVSQWPQSANNTEQHYGALARDGISCLVCHRIDTQALGEERSYTGNFVTGPPTELYGPYDTVAISPMVNALGVVPQFGAQIANSDMCGTCHNILLPILDNQGNRLGFSYEQTTHLEWQNSAYAPGRSLDRSCQDCHMPTHYTTQSGQQQALSFKIANNESSDFAPTTHRLPDAEIQLTERSQYSRHSLHGLNVFLNEIFQQFPLLLGIRQIDYMTGTGVVPPLITGRNSMLNMAKNETASVSIDVLEQTADGKLRAVVTVMNKAGHYLPSGVGFRRVFLEFLVLDAQDNLLWASGRTNALGAILNGLTDQVLPSEQRIMFPQAFQPHYQRVERGDQVQIYEELIKDSEGNLNTSFVRRVTPVKDNRIRPKGFDPQFFAQNPSPFIQELAELHGEESLDPYYTNPQLTGADQIEYLLPLDAATLARVDHIRVTLYSQSIPPYYVVVTSFLDH